jgi:hypothetical protein
MLKYERSVTRRLGGSVLVTFLAVSLLTACATTAASDYQPRIQGGLVGYSDLELAPNRYRVSFSGSTASTRDDVEKYLLRRSAEVTLQTGHTHFVLTNRDTERDTLYAGYGEYGGAPYYYYPYRSWYGTYPHSYWGGNAWPASYSAYAEITMMDPEEAAQNPQAIEALSLLQRLQAAPALPVASAQLPP